MWKQQLAEYFGYKSFEEMDTSDQRTAEKAVELYQIEFNEKNVSYGVSEISKNKESKGTAPGKGFWASFRESKKNRPWKDFFGEFGI